MFPSPAATRTIQRDCNKESTMISESATILIVEDEQDIRELLAYNLEKEGYATVQAADGKEGLELARSRKPDLILLDLMLPKMDGLAVCRELERDSGTVRVSSMSTFPPKFSKLKKSTKRRAKKRPPLFRYLKRKLRTNCASTVQDLWAVNSALWHCTRPSLTAASVPRLWQRNTESVGTPTIFWTAVEALSTTTGEEWNLTITPNTRNSR